MHLHDWCSSRFLLYIEKISSVQVNGTSFLFFTTCDGYQNLRAQIIKVPPLFTLLCLLSVPSTYSLSYRNAADLPKQIRMSLRAPDETTPLSQLFSLQGRVCLVTGGNRYIQHLSVVAPFREIVRPTDGSAEGLDLPCAKDTRKQVLPG